MARFLGASVADLDSPEYREWLRWAPHLEQLEVGIQKLNSQRSK